MTLGDLLLVTLIAAIWITVAEMLSRPPQVRKPTEQEEHEMRMQLWRRELRAKHDEHIQPDAGNWAHAPKVLLSEIPGLRKGGDTMTAIVYGPVVKVYINQ